jgi:hypothetical protein
MGNMMTDYQILGCRIFTQTHIWGFVLGLPVKTWMICFQTCIVNKCSNVQKQQAIIFLRPLGSDGAWM